MMKKMNVTIKTMAPAIATETKVPIEGPLRSGLRSAELGGLGGEDSGLRSAELGGLGGEDVRLTGGQKMT